MNNRQPVGFMFFLLLIMTILCLVTLSGCATTPKFVEVPKIQPPAEIMGDCGTMQKFKEGTFKEAVELLIANANTFYGCKKLNNAKKEHILNTSR